ncbi:hypothetical protein F2Q69_00048018 [Brassica cretica]|uniref:F-box associated beta-propeller type 3 domain-containing protein n=1 Tax=Brassica cretica TaxID=69181 RepID=A0A8S9PMX9_BRACR|nr:hypothetical protein F2Q69_00048018 [Brassica cretica]
MSELRNRFAIRSRHGDFAESSSKEYKKESIFFFSAPQPQNPGDDSSLVPARYNVHRKHYPKDFSIRVGSPLGGFICRQDKGKVDTIVVSNPVTGESIFLPEVKSKNINIQMIPFLGYDPINKQFKVLCVKFEDVPNTSEKFSFINIDQCMFMTCACTLINYKGKLGALQFTLSNPKCLVFWVLEDAGKLTSGDEVVLATMHLLHPFCIYYYNPKGNTFIRVLIQGLEGFVRARVYTSLDYAENLKHMTEYDKGVNTNIYS